MCLQGYVQLMSKILKGNSLGTIIKSNEMIFNWERTEAFILIN